ncbi:muscle M-line assembly protein unc-89-like isoform X2 [Varroa jacobsoni]|uniref:muscle M-line assembly protein unc-89-like isoform X2 n=1 Tax=Varroa jacobsoni TaxID=62625 RepID=UPI000BF64EF8|nr:muscle M-line assembly protein unc-89-like isoform X2 [Varroa jacobsoni]
MEEPPRLERPLANISVKAGEPLRLSCRVVGTRPTIVWLHNSRNLADARDVQIYRDESSGECSIELREVFPRHAGIYTLLARNTQGETYTSCNVTLANKPPPETSDSELASDLEFSKPVVRKSLRDQTVNEGRSVRLDCIITGVPEPEVIWYHNGRPIKESSDVTFEFEGDHCSLIISSAQLSHLGSYRCKAVNPAGEATSLCKLIVLRQPPETSSRAGTPTGTSMEVACFENASGPARIVKPLSDVQIKHGEKFKLILGVECHPPPEVIWSFQGRPIVLDGDYIFDHVGTSYILDVPRATVDHAGVYSAEVRNAFGSQHSSCRVIVDPLPEDSLALVLAQAEAENAVSTHVTKSFVSSKRTMLMQKMSSSKSNVTADGRLVSSEEHQAATTEKYGFEKLGDAVPSEYHSKESFGFDRVGDNPPEHYYTKEVKDNRIQHKGKSATQLTIEGPAAEGTQPSVLSVPELAAQATNVTTRTSEPKQLSLLQRSGSAHIPPKFSKPLESVAVFAGEQVKLEGWFNGYPEPIVKWSRGSTTLSHKADLQITVEKSYTSLVIPKAMQKDHARYTCVISNDVGSSSSAADVVIQTKRVAPQFTRRLDARVCKSGSEITLEVEVSGAPSPDVKWLRDEIDLKTLNKYDIRSSANKHTLIIRRAEESDSGRYTVLATNIAGEAQSIADIFVEDEVSSEEEREVTIRDYHVQDEKKMEMTMVQAEHIHREQTRVIERQVTPKPNIPALPAPAPPPSLDLLFKKDTSEQKETIIKTTVDPTKIQEPPLLPPPVKVESEQQITKRVDEEHRLEKHVHISQSIMRRQQQFVPPNVMEPVNLIFTPLPSTPTPISSDRVELPPRLPPQPPLSKPVAPTPAPPPSKPAQQPKSPPPRPELTKPKPLPIASPPPELVPPPWVQQRAEVKQQDIEQIKQQVIHQQQKIVLTPPVPPQPLPESLPPLQPPVATKVMSERKIEQTAQILKLEKMISSPPLVPLPQRVEPTRKTPEIVKPIKPIETSPSPVAPVQPKPKKLVKQQPKVVAESKPAPPPPPPQLPEIKPSQVKPKRASPPLRPPPPPKFRDEMLTYEAIRQQEMERIQRQCKKITLIEQCERQTTQVSDDRSMLIEQSFRKLQSPPRSPPPVLPPAASPVPSRTPHRPAEFHVVTRVFQKTRPLDLEEGITKFYKDYKETSKTVVTRTRTPSLPPERIPVVSVCHLSQPPFPLRKPSPEPFCRLEKSELRVEESRRQRSVSPCLLQEHIREVKRVLPPSPVCRVQEVDIHRKEVAPPPEHIDVLNLTSSVIHIERKPSPTPICTLREYGVHQTDKTYRDQTQLVDLREDCLARSRLPSPIPICQIKEVDHKVTDGRRLNTTVCVNLTEKQPVTASNVKSVATDSADKIYTSKLSYVDLQEKQVSRPVPQSLPLLCRVQDKTRQFRSVTPPASIRCVDKTYSSISKIVDICRAPHIPSSSEDKVWIVQDNRGKVRRSASDSRRFDQNFNIQVTETTPVAAPPQIPVKTFQPVKVTEGLPLHTTPASVQRFIRTAEWVEGAQSVDRNVLLTEQVKRKAPTDNQTTTSIVSQQDYSTPRQMEPLSTSVYVDQHTKVVSAPPIPPVQVTPSLPVIHRTDEVSTVSITMSDATPPSAPVQPVVPPSPKPAAMFSNAQNAKGQYSFRDFTDSKISRDTSSFVHLETHVDAISQTELQRATVTPRRQQPPPAAPSSFPTQEPVYQTLPSTNVTRSSSADFSLFTRHQLAQRKVDTTMSSRRDDIRMALSEKISNFKEREESRHIQAPCTLPHRRVACGTKTSLFTSGFEELSSPMQTETQAVCTARPACSSLTKKVSANGDNGADINKQKINDEALTEISVYFRDLLSYTSSDESRPTNLHGDNCSPERRNSHLNSSR